MELQQTQATLAHRDERLRVLRDRIQNLKHQLQTKEDEVQAMHHELSSKEAEIAAMKTSKFWKLRMLWMKVRSRLGRSTP